MLKTLVKKQIMEIFRMLLLRCEEEPEALWRSQPRCLSRFSCC